MTKRFWSLALMGVATVMAVASVVEINARQQNGAVSIDNDDLGGVEAG